MKFSVIPFSRKYAVRKYKYLEFTERGHRMAFLHPVKANKSNSFNSKVDYKFGVISDDNKYYWFFLGKTVTKDRVEALEIYNALYMYCKKENIGKPFAFKNV